MIDANRPLIEASLRDPRVYGHRDSIVDAYTAMATPQISRGKQSPHSARNPQKAYDAWQKGLALAKQEQWVKALAEFERATILDPSDGVFWLNLAQACRKLGRPAQAVHAAERALKVNPSLELAARMLTICLIEQHRPRDAILYFERLREQGPLSHAELAAYGRALYDEGRPAEAAEVLLQALALKKDHVPAYVDLGNALTRLHMPEAAAEAMRTAAVLMPDQTGPWCDLIYWSMCACRWDHLDDDFTALQNAMRAGRAALSPFSVFALPVDAAFQHLVTRAYTHDLVGAIEPLPPVKLKPKRAGERIRVGYLSSDLHQHATAMLLAEVLELRQRDRFAVTLYSYGVDDHSPMRARLQSACDAFVDVQTQADVDVARRIRADGIDILVDLKGHTEGGRMGICAHRPAPIQVNYLGFPGTLGADFIDYVVTDPIVTPFESGQHFSEKLAYLPDCYQPNDRQRPLPPAPSRVDCGLPKDGFVFCCFNNSYKITPEVFTIWCRLLQAVPGSVLWLMALNTQARTNLCREAQARGIDPARLVFASFVPQAENLARLQNADLFLDTLPVNAHTTASDALWAGVPLLTLPGQTFVSRVAASLVHAVGLDGLIAGTAEEYEAIALRLARSPDELRALRERLNATRLSSALFDSARYARNLEALYERMYEQHLRAGHADHLMPACALAVTAGSRP